MKRRAFVKGLLVAPVAARAALAQQTGSASPVPPATAPAAGPTPALGPTPAPGPTPWMSGLAEARPLMITPLVADEIAQTGVHFFSSRQMATLRRLSDVLLPPMNGYPGALDTGAPEFLDFFVGGSPVERQQMYRLGLDRLDAEAKEQFHREFAEVSDSQSDTLLRPWLRAWIDYDPPADPYARFINLAHYDIRKASINSKPWSDADAAAGKPADTGLYWRSEDSDLPPRATEFAADQQARNISGRR